MTLFVPIVTRAEWGARPPKTTPFPISMPTPEFWLHHSAGSGSDEPTVRGIQNFHMDGRGWNDIAYSFLIDNDSPDIDVFEGRGAGIAGGHTAGHNTISHAICIIGNYTTVLPNPDTMEKIALLMAYGHQEGWWPLTFTGGHRDASGAATTCPGDKLWAAIPNLNARAIEIHEESLMPTAEEIAVAVRAELVTNPIAVASVTTPVDITKPGTGAFLRQNLLLDSMPGTAGAGSVKERLTNIKTDTGAIVTSLASAQDKLDTILEAIGDTGNPDLAPVLDGINEANGHLVAIREGLGSAGF